MKQKQKIEKKVAEYYKVSVEDLYNIQNNKYPLNGARSVFMYLLYASRKYKIYNIQKMFGYSSPRTVEIRVADVSSSIKKDNNKLAEDVKTIKEKLNEKIK